MKFHILIKMKGHEDESSEGVHGLLVSEKVGGGYKYQKRMWGNSITDF